MKIAVIGGGPGGLYFARLMKRHDPRHEIVVVEQNPADATYGFGVALGGTARERIRDADPDLHTRLEAAMVFENRQTIKLDAEAVTLEYVGSGGAITRLDLLQILQAACAEVGVDVEHGTRAANLDRFKSYDLIVAADGANSMVRAMYADKFGTQRRHLTNHLAWYGVKKSLVPNGLAFRTHAGGYFVGHYYAYTDTMSTFVPECDAQTWRLLGFEAMPDADRRAYMENVFEPELQGAKLIDNKSQFRNLPILTNARWTHDNIVLIGDALRPAHPSIGSGTRLAMDDAHALFDALREKHGDVPAALRRYVEIRKPVRELFQTAMERSYMWYERLRTVMQQPIMDFVYDFLTRTGRIDDARLAVYAPSFHKQYSEYRMRRRA